MPVGGHSVNTVANLEHLIALGQGGGISGVIRTLNEGAVTARAPAVLRVDVDTLRGFILIDLYCRDIYLATQTETTLITVPTGGSGSELRRIDLVQFTYGSGINIKEGTESGSPSAPSADPNSLVLAEIHCRNNMASVKQADDAANGWIVDRRRFL